MTLFDDEDQVIFEQDHASAHTSKIAQEFFTKKGITVIPNNTPAKMDDIWPIERLWGILVPVVYRDPTPTTAEQLRERVFDAWTSVLPGTCKVLIHELPFRIKKMVELRGEKIRRKLKECEKCQCEFCVNWRMIHKHENVYSKIVDG